MNQCIKICILILLLTVALWLPKTTSAGEQQPLAAIDGQPITGKDFQDYLKLFDNDPRFRSDTPEARKKLLEHLIDRTILLQYAKKHDYLKLKELKTHKSLNQQEKDTIILRQLLTDKISSQAHCSEAEIEAYRKDHPKLSAELAKEQLTSQKQQELYKAFMGQRKKEHTIIVYQKNLEHL